MTLDIVLLYGPAPSQRLTGMAYFFKDHTVLPATHAFIHEWNEPYLPLPSQPNWSSISDPRGMAELV